MMTLLLALVSKTPKQQRNNDRPGVVWDSLVPCASPHVRRTPTWALWLQHVRGSERNRRGRPSRFVERPAVVIRNTQ